MNQYQVRTTAAEKAEFYQNKYPLMQEEGTFHVTLLDKCWGDRKNLLCAFETPDKHKFRISILWRSRDGKYAPGDSMVDFSVEPLGSRWICSFGANKKGYINMNDAIPDYAAR